MDLSVNIMAALQFLPLWNGTKADVDQLLRKTAGDGVALTVALTADQLPPLEAKLEKKLRKQFSLPMLASLGPKDKPPAGPTYVTDRVTSWRLQYLFKKTCPSTEKYFRQALDPKSQEMASALVRIDGVVVGVIKNFQHNLFLGLQNVRDSDGRYPIVRGGVYMVPGDGRDEMFKQVSHVRPHVIIDIPQLWLYPQRRIRHGIRSRFYSRRKFHELATALVAEHSNPAYREGEGENMVFRSSHSQDASPSPQS